VRKLFELISADVQTDFASEEWTRPAGELHEPLCWRSWLTRGLFIATTAVLHDLCVVTRNAGDFLLTGVPVLNPWTDTEPRLAE